MLEQLSEGGAGVTGYRFRHWERPGKPTHEVLGIKAIPGVDPREVIVAGYRVAYWYLLRPETEARAPRQALAASSTSGRGWRLRVWWGMP